MISVDSVYQTVLALANKEQRGYITPQEFNLFANLAQMDIFKQYFHDLDQARRRVSNDTGYSDMVTATEEKISMFEKQNQVVSVVDGFGNFNIMNDIPLSSATFQSEFYKLTKVSVFFENHNNTTHLAEEVQLKEIARYVNSPLVHSSFKSSPIYALSSENSNDYNGLKIQVFPHPVPGDEVTISYIRKPDPPNWTYVINNDSALFNPNPVAGFRDFELHPSEESILVLKILQLAGINIKDGSLVQLASQEEIKKIQQEKA